MLPVELGVIVNSNCGPKKHIQVAMDEKNPFLDEEFSIFKLKRTRLKPIKSAEGEVIFMSGCMVY